MWQLFRTKPFERLPHTYQDSSRNLIKSLKMATEHYVMNEKTNNIHGVNAKPQVSIIFTFISIFIYLFIQAFLFVLFFPFWWFFVSFYVFFSVVEGYFLLFYLLNGSYSLRFIFLHISPFLFFPFCLVLEKSIKYFVNYHCEHNLNYIT